MCNAWNHPVGCTCGWGGDTGGGGYVSTAIEADGSIWSSSRQKSRESFTNPNARCPVCGDPVFFYRSPYGGRVFFDELGPPWTKHPCTDNLHVRYKAWVLHAHVDPWIGTPQQAQPSLGLDGIWKPLVYAVTLESDEFEVWTFPIGPSGNEKIHLWLRSEDVWDGPTFWRWSLDDPLSIELSYLMQSNDMIVENTRNLAIWIENIDQAKLWLDSGIGSPDAKKLNSIAFAMSLEWLTENVESLSKIPKYYLTNSRALFEMSSQFGSWAAINNIGVMLRDGIGCKIQLEEAFKKFELAAQSLEIVPLRHLQKCYENGIGCVKNKEMSQFINELIEIQNQKRRHEKSLIVHKSQEKKSHDINRIPKTVLVVRR